MFHSRGDHRQDHRIHKDGNDTVEQGPRRIVPVDEDSVFVPRLIDGICLGFRVHVRSSRGICSSRYLQWHSP
nr:hypothetical protein CFP56_76250 [Quercus suber]